MRILFVGPTRIGDAVLSSGLLDHLGGKFPDARFTVACGVAAAPLFEELPKLERLIPMEKRPRGAHWWRLWRQVCRRRWSLVVDLRRSPIPWTVVCARRAISPPASRRDEHAVVSAARALGLADAPPVPRLWTGERHRRAARELIPPGPPVLAIGPTANWDGKTWPAERFAETVRRLTRAPGAACEAILTGARVAVFGAQGARVRARPVIDAIPRERRIDLVGRIDLPTASACLGRAALFIGNDSGLMHMAAAAGIPTLGLFGPSRPERYGPWGPQAAWVGTEKPFRELVAAPGDGCRPAETLMASLPVDSVVGAAGVLWRRSGGGAG